MTGLDAVGVGISSFIRTLLGHRGPLHWPLWGIVIMLAARVGNLPPWAFWLGFGYAAHILGDALTKSGVPLFGPLSDRDISLTPMTVGGFVESGLGYVLWSIAVWLGWPVIANMPYINELVRRFGIWGN